jgi:hypothetical protein
MTRTAHNVERFSHLSDEGFVQRCYALLLHRLPDASGRDHYLTRLRMGDARALVWQALANDVQAPPDRAVAAGETPSDLNALLKLDGSHFVAAAYRYLLDRPADPEGARHYGEALKSGSSKADVIASLYRSAEGRGRGVDLPEVEIVIRRMPARRAWQGYAWLARTLRARWSRP